MADLLGFTAIAIAILMTLLIAIRWPDTSKFILIALIFRIMIMLAGHYWLTLPDTTQDAAGFENLAWTWSQKGFFHNLSNYPGYNSFFYIWINALIYSLFGRSVLMLQSISLSFGVLSVLLGWLVAKKLWDNHVAMKVGWTLALFPSLALYSILPLREVYSSFFLLVAIFGVVNWFKEGSYKSIILVLLGFFGAVHFHAVLMVGGIVFFLILGLKSLKKFFKNLLSNHFSLKSFIAVSLILIFFIIYLSNQIYIPYLGTFEMSTDMGYLKQNMIYRMKGDASYPDWTIINSSVELIYKGFIRIFYFLFSPFFWDIKKISHLLGFFDGLLFLILVYLIFKNRKVIWNDPALKMILLILFIYFIMFGIGVSNFGAALRHRSKFVIEMVLLAAPLFPTFSFANKKKKKL